MKQEGLTQKELAERMNCTQQYVSKILKGKENMSLDTLSRLEDALGNFGELSLYLNPLIHSPRRTIHSGFVFLDPIAAIFLCRFSAESLSIMAQQLPQAQIRKQAFPDE